MRGMYGHTRVVHRNGAGSWTFRLPYFTVAHFPDALPRLWWGPPAEGKGRVLMLGRVRVAAGTGA